MSKSLKHTATFILFKPFVSYKTINTKCLFTIGMACVSGGVSLKLINISVPQYTLRGEQAQLQCQYDLQNDRLYSVTWYKDHEEFYRYVPRSNPAQLSYKMDGIKVDVSM